MFTIQKITAEFEQVINNDIFAITVVFYLEEWVTSVSAILRNLMKPKENIFNEGTVIERVAFSTTTGL